MIDSKGENGLPCFGGKKETGGETREPGALSLPGKEKGHLSSQREGIDRERERKKKRGGIVNRPRSREGGLFQKGGIQGRKKRSTLAKYLSREKGKRNVLFRESKRRGKQFLSRPEYQEKRLTRGKKGDEKKEMASV